MTTQNILGTLAGFPFQTESQLNIIGSNQLMMYLLNLK